MAVATRLVPTARPATDRDEIAAYLRTDRRYAAYALGDLDGPQRGRVAWALAHDQAGRPVALRRAPRGPGPAAALPDG